MRKILFLTIAFSLLMAGHALAGWEEGVAAFTSKNYQAAAGEFQELVDKQPNSFQGHYMLGLTLQQLNRKEEALNHLRKAYDLNPNDLNTKLALGKAYHAARRYGDVTNLLGSVDVNPLPSAQKVAFYQMRGQARLKQKDSSGAMNDFSQLAKLKPNDAQVQFNYGSLAIQAGQMDKGLAALDKAVKLAPNDADKKRTYVQSLIKKGRESRDKTTKKTNYLKASELAGELVAKDGSYDNQMLKLSAELGAGAYDKAIESAKAAIAKKDTDWLAHFYLGQAYSSAKQYDAAVQPLLTAKEKVKEPNDLKQVWRQLGFTYEKQKKYTQSIEAYNFAGDATAAARVKENQDTAQFNAQVEAENKRIQEMEAEAKRLEEELKALEGGGGL